MLGSDVVCTFGFSDDFSIGICILSRRRTQNNDLCTNSILLQILFECIIPEFAVAMLPYSAFGRTLSFFSESEDTYLYNTLHGHIVCKREKGRYVY